MVDSSVFQSMKTSQGASLAELSDRGPVLLVFLRHFGCVFCQEALKDISKKKNQWIEKGVQVVFVHMSDSTTADSYFKKYGLADMPHVSDPDCLFYAKFGLTKGTVGQLFGLQNWFRGAEVTLTGKALPTLKQLGDGFQMPGIFLVADSEVRQSFIHNSASDKPDYDGIINCCAA